MAKRIVGQKAIIKKKELDQDYRTLNSGRIVMPEKRTTLTPV